MSWRGSAIQTPLENEGCSQGREIVRRFQNLGSSPARETKIDLKRRTCMGTSYTGTKRALNTLKSEGRAKRGGEEGEDVRSMSHEKENDHRSGGNGKKESGGPVAAGGVIEWKKKVEVRVEMHLTLSP